MTLRLELLSTDHCSLCEQALDLLLSMQEIAGVELMVVDIATDEELMARYADSIPVLRAVDEEIAAPFAQHQIIALLERAARRVRKNG